MTYPGNQPNHQFPYDQQFPSGSTPAPHGNNNGGDGNGSRSYVGLIVGLLALVAVIGVGVVVYFLNNSGPDQDESSQQIMTTSPSPTTPSTETTTITTTPSTSSSTTKTSEPSTETSETSEEPSEDNSLMISPPGADSKLTGQGWSSYRSATCNDDDEWTYAAYGDGDYVVVCRSNETGRLYYRARVADGDLERDVDDSSADETNGRYTVPVSTNTKIEIDGDDLAVYKENSVSSRVHFDRYYTR